MDSKNSSGVSRSHSDDVRELSGSDGVRSQDSDESESNESDREGQTKNVDDLNDDES